jgi:hypothetical protein
VFTPEQPASATNVLRLGAPRRARLGAPAVIAIALLALLVVRGSAYLPFVGGAGAQSAITGLVRASGHNGVGPFPNVELAISGTTAKGARFVRHATTDKHGHFALNVPPGRYTVRPINPGGPAPKRATVRRDRTTRLRFWFRYL